MIASTLPKGERKMGQTYVAVPAGLRTRSALSIARRLCRRPLSELVDIETVGSGARFVELPGALDGREGTPELVAEIAASMERARRLEAGAATGADFSDDFGDDFA